MTVGPRKFPPSNPSTVNPRPSSMHTAPSSMLCSIISSARSVASLLINGPTSTPSTNPFPTFRSLACATSSCAQPRLSSKSPTKTTTLSAIHRCPAAPNAAPTIALIVLALSASSIITVAWFLAPIFAWTRFPFLLPMSWMYSPALFDPTNDIALMSGCVKIPSTVSFDPLTTLTTPGGRPRSCKYLVKRSDAEGAFSVGLRTYVLPVAIAKGYIQSAIMAGKLNGAIPAQTPNGTRYETVSSPLARFCNESPSISLPTRVAASTTSKPLQTSPIASAVVFPCSSVIQ
mmetsp:Transcript_30590/g.55452  ORF Transcript_30590/g.55452 Transcript_30590/m.55452 type:complete len:288 (-) Transcript_30590:577-1440(-)